MTSARARSVMHLLALVVLAATTLVAWLPGRPAAADTVGVEVTDDGFVPVVVTVVVGDTVQWTWTGQGQHGVRAASGEFDSHPGCSPLATVQCGGPGSTFSHTVGGEPRTINYSDPATGAAGRIVVETASEPSPGPSQDPTPEPTEEPSPEPTGEASPLPTGGPSPSEEPEPSPSPTSPPPSSAEPTPEPTPEPSPEPTPEPESTFTFQPPAPRETAPPVVVTPTETASPTATSTRDRPSLEPFPSFDPDRGTPSGAASSTDDVAAGEVTIPTDDDPARVPALVVAGAMLVATLATLSRVVLFGPPW